MTASKNSISETHLRRIVREEIERKYLLDEGLWDDVKDGVKKLSDYVSKKFKSAVGEWSSIINEKIQALSKKPEGMDVVMSAIKYGMKDSGEALVLDKTLKIAKSLNKETVSSAIQSDLEGPIHDTAQQFQKSGKKLGEVYSILSTREYTRNQKVLKEMGPATILGFGLAIVGGLPMLFKGLHKLAIHLKAEKLAEIFEKAEHISHALEEKTIDYMIPDKLSYSIYKFLNEKGFHVSKKEDLMSYEEYKSDADKSGARKKTEGLVYKSLLIYFALNGLMGVLHAGASLLGFVEGGATAVKGIELVRGAKEVAKIVGSSVASTSV